MIKNASEKISEAVKVVVGALILNIYVVFKFLTENLWYLLCEFLIRHGCWKKG